MRSRFLALCGLLTLANPAFAQGTPPSIAAQPASVNAYLGDNVVLTTLVDGTAPVSYQWYKNTVALSGATTTQLVLTAVTLSDAAVYHLVAANAFGSAQTLPIGVLVTKRPQTITFNPPAITGSAGSGLTLNASASSGLPISFSIVSGAGSISGNVVIGTGGNVIVRASQPGNATFDAAEPVEQVFSFVAGSLSPFITLPPFDQTVTAGGSVTFQATAIGTPAPTYQWQKDGATLAGATNASLTLATTSLADTGRYTLVAANLAGTASAAATLTVRAAPIIVTAPASQTVFAGDRTVFSVSVTGFPAPTYQWRRNGTTISGATGATLTLAGAASTDAGRYEVVVTNPLGSVTSATATLTVNSRDFSGFYFGRLAGTDGDFALYVRADRTAVFLAHLPAQQTGVAISTLRVELAGTFALNTVTLASGPGLSLLDDGSPATAAAPRPVTVRGTLDDATGAVNGTLAELGISFSGTRSARTGPAGALAGHYTAAVIGSAAGRGEVIVSPEGQVLVLSANGTTLEAARGTLGTGGRFTATTSSQATLDLTFADGVLNGTARTSTTSSTITGMIDALAGNEHLVNLSIRATTSPGAASLITGFVVAGTTPKQVLIRAAGPTLAQAPFNVPNTLPDPTLQVFRGNTPVAQNDDWGTPAANVATLTAAATRAGAFPLRAGSADAALLTTLQPGAYSVVIGGGNGTVLAEVYEVLQANEAAGARRLVNLSARGLVSPAASLVAGFVIDGPGPQRVLIRGIGPSLSAPPFNVAGALPNSNLVLFRGAVTVKTNDDWFRDPEAALIRDAATRAGAFALGANSLDAAMLLYLEPGSYTVQVNAPAGTGAANATGLALVEVYEARP